MGDITEEREEEQVEQEEDGDQEIQSPRGRRTQSTQAEEGTEDPDHEEEETRSRERARRPQPRSPQTARELFLDSVALRAKNAEPRLKTHLTGTLLVHLIDCRDRFFLDWTGEVLIIRELSVEEAGLFSLDPQAKGVQNMAAASEEDVQKGSASFVDSIIQISEKNLLKIASGSLNAQIAMLSDKIRVEGKLEIAVYFFNLIAPEVW